MKFIKDAMVDIVVTIVIVSAVMGNIKSLELLVIIYTGFILAVKILVLTGGYSSKLSKRIKTTVPNWFYHLLYAFNLIVLAGYGWWITALEWGVIWVLSWWSFRKS